MSIVVQTLPHVIGREFPHGLLPGLGIFIQFIQGQHGVDDVQPQHFPVGGGNYRGRIERTEGVCAPVVNVALVLEHISPVEEIELALQQFHEQLPIPRLKQCGRFGQFPYTQAPSIHIQIMGVMTGARLVPGEDIPVPLQLRRITVVVRLAIRTHELSDRQPVPAGTVPGGRVQLVHFPDKADGRRPVLLEPCLAVPAQQLVRLARILAGNDIAMIFEPARNVATFTYQPLVCQHGLDEAVHGTHPAQNSDEHGLLVVIIPWNPFLNLSHP